MKPVWFLMAVAVSLVNLRIVYLFVFEEVFFEAVLGWSISFINFCLHLVIERCQAIKSRSQVYMRSLGLNAARAGLFLITICVILLFADVKTGPFVYSVFSAYFIFLYTNILNLHLESIKQ